MFTSLLLRLHTHTHTDTRAHRHTPAQFTLYGLEVGESALRGYHGNVAVPAGLLGRDGDLLQGLDDVRATLGD